MRTDLETLFVPKPFVVDHWYSWAETSREYAGSLSGGAASRERKETDEGRELAAGEPVELRSLLQRQTHDVNLLHGTKVSQEVVLQRATPITYSSS
jgi:hypothetical protein